MTPLQMVNRIGLLEIISTFVAAAIARLVYFAFLHPLSIYPGPPLAAQTYLWRFFFYFKGKQQLTDRELHNKYGAVVRDGPNSLLVSDLEAYKAVYGLKYFEKGTFYSSIPVSGEPVAFAARTSEQHRRARKHLGAGFTPKAIASYEQTIAKNVDIWMDKIASENRKSGDPINLAPFIRLLQFDTVFEVIFGRSMGIISAGEDVCGAIAAKEAAIKIGFGIGIVPWMAQIFSSKFISSRLRRPKYTADGRLAGIGAIVQHTQEPMKLAREGKLDAAPPSILKHLIEDEPIESDAAQQDLTEREAMNAVFAGTGSTAAGLNAILYEMGLHTEWQSRVFEELRSLISPLPQSSMDLPYSDLSKLPNLRAVVKESLRLSPPFPSSFPREVGMSYGAVAIPGLAAPLPPGTKIGANHYVICRSRSVFGDDADEFRPERWLNSIDDEKQKRMEEAWSVFGRGPRICVAKDLAMMMLYKAVVALLLKWEAKTTEEGLKRSNDFEFHVHELLVSLTPRQE